MGGRLRGCLWLTAGLIVALLAGFIGFATLSQATAQRSGETAELPEVTVVVAARAVTVRSPLADADVQLKKVPVDSAPEGAVQQTQDAIGKLTLVDLYPGEILLTQRLADPNVASGDGRLAVVVNGEDVLMAMPAGDLMSSTGVLKPGDHVDILFSLDFSVDQAPAAVSTTGEAAAGGVVVAAGQDERQVTFDSLQNGVVSAIVAAPVTDGATDRQTPAALLLTVSPQDALVLKYIKDAGGVMDLVVRAPGTEGPFTSEPVDETYLKNRYQVPALTGR